MINTIHQLPETGFLRLSQIIGNKKENLPALLPISRATFYRRIETGHYPKPIRLGLRSVAWRVDDIRKLLSSLGGEL